MRISFSLYNEYMRLKSPLVPLFFTIFLDMVGYGILIPVIPMLLAEPSSPHYLLPESFTLGEGYVLLGVLTATFSIGSFFAAPIIGQLSDRVGRRKMLLLSVLGTALGHALFAIGIAMRSLPLLFVARFADGLTGGNIAVAQASIADATRPEDRAKNFGLIGAAFGLGFIIGPFLGGKLADPGVVSWFDATVPFWFATLLALVNVVFIWTMLPETRVPQTKHISIMWSRAIGNITRAFRHPSLKALYTTQFLYQSGFTFYTTFAAVFFAARFGFTEGDIGDYFAYIGIWIVFTQGVVTRVLSRRMSEQVILRVSIAGTALAILAVSATHDVEFLYLIAPFLAISNGLSLANLTSLVSRSASAEIQGEVLGVGASVSALAISIPPLLAGFLAALIAPEAPLAAASAFIFLAALNFIAFYRRTRTE